MRTKNGKWIGPVPITLVAVFALAAFISVGLLLAVPGGQTAEAQGLPGSGTTPDGTEGCDVVVAGVGAATSNTVQGGKCNTSADELAVNFVNKSGTADDVAVYVTGGSKFRKVQGSSSNSGEISTDAMVMDTDKIGKRGVDEYLLSVAASNISGDGKETVTVSRDMADGDGKVYLFVFDAEQMLDGSSISLADGAQTSVVVQFVGAPVAKADHDDNNATDQVVTSALVITDDSYIDTTNDGAENVIEIMDTDTDEVVDGGISSNVDKQGDVPSTRTSVWVTAEFRDANLKPVTGTIEFVLGTPSEGAEGVRFGAGGTTRIEYGAYQAGFQVMKLPEGKDVESFKIPVMATITSAGNTLTVTTNIVRMGDAVMVEATAYACAIATSGDKADTDADIDPGDSAAADGIQEDEACSYEIGRLTNDKASDDPDEIGALAGEDLFFISAKATDTAGNVVANSAAKSLDDDDDISSWEITASADNVADARTAIDGDVTSPGTQASGDANETIRITDDAKPGTYSITVTSPDGEVSTMIMVTVSDDASNLSVTCDPEMIPIATGLTDCTVTVTDQNGNVPSNLHKKMDDADKIIKDTVRVAVRSKDVTLIGTDDNDVTLDENGMASFSILLREDAAEGNSITVNVSSTIGDESLQASTTVAYGDPATTPGMPMNVMAEATSDTMITVSWESPAADGGNDITGYMVQSAYMMSDGMMSDWMDVDPAHMGMDMMYMDMGLMAETTYYYRVAAMNSSGMGDYSDGMAMATTMMATTMMDELGTVTDVITGFNRGGALQVSWTKAANASGYIIIAINVNDVNRDVVAVVLNDGDLDTQNISGLTPGATYDIYVAATASGGRNTLSDAARVTAQ